MAIKTKTKQPGKGVEPGRREGFRSPFSFQANLTMEDALFVGAVIQLLGDPKLEVHAQAFRQLLGNVEYGCTLPGQAGQDPRPRRPGATLRVGELRYYVDTLKNPLG